MVHHYETPCLTSSVYTGGHLASLDKVCTGEVSAAAIDCVTYGLAEIHAPHLTRNSRVLTLSQTFPALPYIVSNDASDNTVRQVQEAIKDAMEDETLAWVTHFITLHYINTFNHWGPFIY